MDHQSIDTNRICPTSRPARPHPHLADPGSQQIVGDRGRHGKERQKAWRDETLDRGGQVGVAEGAVVRETCELGGARDRREVDGGGGGVKRGGDRGGDREQISWQE